MKSAKELFEELGYKLTVSSAHRIVYTLDNNKWLQDIEFGLEDKIVFAENGTTMQELLAINKMVKELGWLDE